MDIERCGNYSRFVGELRPMEKAPITEVSVPQAARLLGKPERTVRFWCMRGWMVSTQSPGGRYRVSLAEIERVRVGAPLPPHNA